MAPLTIIQQSTATHGLHCFTPSLTSSSTSMITDRKRRRRAFYHQARLRFIIKNPQAPAGYLLHETEHLRRTVPELRHTMKRAGLDGKPRPRHRREGRRSRHVYHTKSLRSSWMEVEQAVETRSSMMKMDWKEDDEEGGRPCYWSLVEKLNRELRITGD